MIAVDCSALVAIAVSEAGHEPLLEALVSNEAIVGAPVLFETFCVLKGRRSRESDARRFCAWVEDLGTVRIVSFDLAHANWAQLAFERFGKGTRSGVRLNILDCMSYAFAKVAAAPLLCTGNEFTKSDLTIHPSSRTS